MDTKLIVVVALLLAAAAQASTNTGVHLWLNCKVVSHTVNVNIMFIISRDKVLIIGGEPKMLNTSNPRAVFEEIKQACLAAVRELNKVANNTERGLQTSMRIRNLLAPANASSRVYGAAWIE